MEECPPGSDRWRWVLRISQTALARALGVSAGTVSYHLRALGPIVLQRRRGVLVFDADALDAAHLASDPEVTGRARELAGRLAMRLGAGAEQGIALMSRRRPGRPAAVREMAETLGMSPSALRGHLARLVAAGAIECRGRVWVLPPPLGELRSRLGSDERRQARAALEFLTLARHALDYAADSLLEFSPDTSPPDQTHPPNDPVALRLWSELHRLANEAHRLLAACNASQLEVLFPAGAHDDQVIVVSRPKMGADTW